MIKPLAIYLPQYHPIPENDKAWGEGFTEWTNVRKSEPMFDGHYQPHIPHKDVGYYDLRDPEIMVRQALMAKAHGIYGFAFYHYWFNGKRLLNLPLDNMLQSGKPDFPFLYIWANEHWSRRWNGSDHEIIQAQNYSKEDDINHMRFLCDNVFSDKRYITIDDKPVFIVYRTELLPDIIETARIWRETAIECGYKGLYLVRVENFVSGIIPAEIGFDAAMEFAPDWKSEEKGLTKKQTVGELSLFDYPSMVHNMMNKELPIFPWFRCVFPYADTTARRKKGGFAFVNNSLEVFDNFVYNAIEYTKSCFEPDSQFFFINAWNEWAEGCHIEPDIKYEYSFLESIKRQLDLSQIASNKGYVDYIKKNWKLTQLEKKKVENELGMAKNINEKYVNSPAHRFVESILDRTRHIRRFLKSNFKYS